MKATNSLKYAISVLSLATGSVVVNAQPMLEELVVTTTRPDSDVHQRP